MTVDSGPLSRAVPDFSKVFPLVDRFKETLKPGGNDASTDGKPVGKTDTGNDLVSANGVSLAAIDRQLIDLLRRRAELVRGEFSGDKHPEIAGMMQSQSEQIERLLVDEKADSPLPVEQVSAWLRHAASICLARLHASRVAFLGPEYSYSHLAALSFFGDSAPMAAVATIPAVFEAIVRGDAESGLVPIENSTDGRIVDTLGMFIRVNVKICGEVLLPIHHNLLSRSPRESIREVHSKPQALSQCRGWLAKHLPQAKLVECGSTTAAAELAASRPGIAAVASIEAARQYNLDVIDASIEDNPNNVTRFAVLGRRSAARSGNDKTAILFQVAHRPGALADAMLLFKDAGLNLTWIESFPLPGTSAEYLFFVEVAGHESDKPVADVLAKLGQMALRTEVLGSYPRAQPVTP